jgi:hypothetical protein
MAQDDSYARYLLQIVPTWLRGRFGGGWMESLGLVQDGQVEAARQAVLARFVTRAPVDGLPLLASERQLERLPPDTDDSWRARLLAAWDWWAWAGTKRGIRDILLATGYATGVEIRNAHEWPSGPGVQGWATFWVILTGHGWTDDGTWGDPGTWGDGGTWGSSASPEEVDRVLRLVRQWKPAEAYCGGVLVMLGGELWGFPEGTWGDPGVWGGSSIRWLPEG